MSDLSAALVTFLIFVAPVYLALSVAHASFSVTSWWLISRLVLAMWSLFVAYGVVKAMTKGNA